MRHYTGKAGISWVKFTFMVQLVYSNAHSYWAALIQDEFIPVLLALCSIC